MRRRNAFVNHFGCVGNNAPDAEYAYGPSVPAAVRAQTPQALRPSSDVSVAERRNWEQTRLQFNKADTSQQDEIAKLAAMSSARSPGSAASAGGGPSDEMDDEPAQKRQSSSFSAAADEPEKDSSWEEKSARKSKVKKRKRGEAALDDLKAFAFDATDDAKDAASSSSDEEEISDDDVEEDEEEDRLCRDASTVTKSSTKVAFKDSSHDEQRVFTKAIGQDHSQKQFKRHRVAMRRNSIFRTLEVSVALKDAADAAAAESESPIEEATSPPSPSTDRSANASKPMQAVQDAVSNVTSKSSGVTTDGGWAAAAAAVGRRREGSPVQEPRGGSADQARSPKRKRDQESATPSPQKKIPSTPEPISWSHFGGTAAVVDVARETRLRMESRRQSVKESQQHRQEEDDANEASRADASLGPTSGESVGINDGDEKDAPKRSKSSKKSSQKQKTCRLSHADFESMDVIGQFNLGFILARCRNNHLWILDQHACDEKFNFERLCATTTVHEQKLIAPLPLELSPSEESCVLDNMDIFEKNGFRFRYDSEKPPRHRLSLTALPHSGSGGDGHKAVQFGKEDVGALCAILGADGASSSLGFVAGSGTGADGSGLYGNNAVRRYAGGNNMEGPSIVRLPKAVAMFASRACRSSIMIGTALSEKEMEAVVRKMKDVVQPWDCAHGRPTLRHVTDILQTMLTDERAVAQHIAGPNLAAFTQAEVDDDDDAE